MHRLPVFDTNIELINVTLNEHLGFEKIMRHNFEPSGDYYVCYVVNTGTGVYPAFYAVDTENSITAYTAIATWGPLPFSLPPPLTMRGVIHPLAKIFVFLFDEQLRHCYLCVAERE